MLHTDKENDSRDLADDETRHVTLSLLPLPAVGLRVRRRTWAGPARIALEYAVENLIPDM